MPATVIANERIEWTISYECDQHAEAANSSQHCAGDFVFYKRIVDKTKVDHQKAYKYSDQHIDQADITSSPHNLFLLPVRPVASTIYSSPLLF